MCIEGWLQLTVLFEGRNILLVSAHQWNSYHSHSFWVVNWMVSTADFKLIIHFNVSDSCVARWCMSRITDPITNFGWVGRCTFPISVVISFTSFHYWLILTVFTILEWILDMFIPVSMDSFEIYKVWVDLILTGPGFSFIVWDIY